jgi:hypothetical protein
MFVFVAGCLVNAFMKNGYLKNLVGIIPSKNMSYVFSATITMYIGLVILLNIALAISCKCFGLVEVEIGIGKEELIYLIFSVLQICVISLAVIIIALFTKNAIIAIIFGLIWSAYFQDVVSMQIKEITSNYQIAEIVVILIICILFNCILAQKRGMY